MAIVTAARDLMPGGNPDFSIIRARPTIEQMKSWPVEQGFGPANLHKLLIGLLRNFCNSVNVPRDKNMNEDQMIEAAGFLLDECDNYRIEDYVMMFTLAKRGKLEVGKTGRIFDRVDISLIADFKANYELLRQQGEDSIQAEYTRKMEAKTLPDPRDNPNEPDEVKRKRFDDALAMLKEMRDKARKERAEQYKRDRDESIKRQEELFARMMEKAEKEGFAGELINLKPFQKKKK